MITIEDSFTVERPIEEVFDYLADVRNELEWNPTILSAEKFTDGPIRAGTRFAGEYKSLGRGTIDIASMERPHSIRFVVDWKRLSFDGDFVLSEVGTGTLVRVALQLQPKGALKLLAPLMAGQIRREMRSHGPMMARAMEARREAEPAANGS